MQFLSGLADSYPTGKRGSCVSQMSKTCISLRINSSHQFFVGSLKGNLTPKQQESNQYHIAAACPWCHMPQILHRVRLNQRMMYFWTECHMISINSVDVRIRGKVVLSNFSWQVKAGEHWVIQGRNGAGKTTLLELLAGKVIPIKGSIHFDFITSDDPWEGYQERQRLIHYVPVQSLHDVLGFQPDMFYQQRYYSMVDERHPVVRDFFGQDIARLPLLNFPPELDVAKLLDLPLTRLSNGQIRKVILIRQLLKSLPKVLLLDYPFEGLDSASRDAMANFIDHLATDLDIQIILTDHHHHWPHIINRRLVLENSMIVDQEDVGEYREEQSQFPENSGNDVPECVVEMRDVTIRYGDRVILENLNWKICKGERWALTGKNGSGKTTLFSFIYADHPLAYSQQVFLFGRRRGTGESIWDIKNRINYLGPEQVHFLDYRDRSKTVMEYWSTTLEKDDSKLNGLILFFSLESLLEKQISELSSGDLQLVLLVRYFLTQRELLLLDEPFQFLDPRRKALVNGYLAQYLAPDSTLILITHYEADIAHWTQLRKRL
jgi:molybdate transport system ATP-binding protein